MIDTISDEEAKRVTLDSYNKHINEYIDKDSSDDIRTLAYWPGVESFLSLLSPGAKILEIGSGTGADANRIEARGFTVQRTDIAQSFVSYMATEGHNALVYDVLEKPFKTTYKAVFANAVFLHFTSGQFRAALKNVAVSLTSNGYFCICMKIGDFEGWREKGLGGKRYFKFWDVAELQAALEASGFSVVYTIISSDGGLAVLTAQKNSHKI